MSLAAILLSGCLRATGADAGAWETFSTQNNANAWTVYDYSDKQFYYPAWSDYPGEESIYWFHTDDAPLWFFTGVDDNAGGGVLVDDYHAEHIQGILCDILIDSLPDFDFVDCAILATGPAGKTYYYSPSFTAADFSESGWWTIAFVFDIDWYYFDEGSNAYVPVEVTPGLLSSVEEIGFRFFPTVGSTLGTSAEIDDVKLMPTVAPAELDVSHTSSELQIAFTPGNGISCTVEEMVGSTPISWQPVPGHTDIVSPSEYVFTTPLGGGAGFFRVTSDEHYTPFTTNP